MDNYSYLIVGGGMTADAAVRGIRRIDPSGTIGLIGAEPFPPYNRPPLSKGLWKGKPVGGIWRGTEKRGVDLVLERRVTEIRPASRQVIDETGRVYGYEKLLIATGGSPKRLPYGDQEILYYRTLGDYYALRERADQHSSAAVIGGGFIGTEIAAALRMNQKDVTLILLETGIGAKFFPPDLVEFLSEFYLKKGVRIHAGSRPIDVEKFGDRQTLIMEDGTTVKAEVIVAGIGIRPNVDLALSAGIEVQDGILVDDTLRTSIPGIFAAGDVASFYNPGLGMQLRLEHEDNANHMGEAAGLNMAGQNTPYMYLPFFYSDLFDIGYEAIGIIDANLKIIADWVEPYRKGVLYYLDDDRVRGVVLWNLWGKVDAARDLVASGEKWSLDRLIGKLA